jgi:hypothetical protein
VSEIPKIAGARLRQQAAGAGSHPDADQLTAFLERSLGAQEREQVLEHLSRCAPCREVVAVALSLPPEEAARVAQSAREFRWFEWQSLRWAAVAATFVIAVSLVFQTYRKTPARESRETAQNRPVAATTPATAPAPAEAGKPAAPAQAEEAKKRQEAPAAADESHAFSTTAVARDKETEVARGPSKLDSVTRAKTGQKTGELAVGNGAGGGIVGGRMDDTKKVGSEGKAEASNGTLAAKPASPAPAMAAQSKRGPAAPAAQQQVAGLAQQAPPSPPATREEVQRQAAAEPASRAAADRAEAAKVTGQNEIVNVESAEKDSDQRARNAAAPAAGFEESRKMSPATATMRWIINAEGRVQRSIDNGQTWKGAALDKRIKFRAVAAAGSDVWAGGEGGTLYHSPDSGNHWTRVPLPAEIASATIVRVEFTDAAHGTLATSSGETWTTSDAGVTWQKK